SYLMMRKTRNKEGEHSLIGFIAFYQSRIFWILQTKRGIVKRPTTALALSRRSGRFPALPYPPLRRLHPNPDAKTVVALVNMNGVETVVPNTCPVAGFEVITVGRF